MHALEVHLAQKEPGSPALEPPRVLRDETGGLGSDGTGQAGARGVLCGLNEVRGRPNAPVVVVEGEKKVEAAKRLFPELVAVSPMNGALSPHKSDWAPVARRPVVIWPDHDEPGRKFAKAATKLAADAGAASVAVVSVPVDWPEGWDLADEPPAAVDSGTLAEMLKSAEPRATPPNGSGCANPRRKP